MNNLEKYLDQVIEQKPVVYDVPAEPEQQAPPNVMAAVRRRWYVVVLVFLLICALILPAIWLLIEPQYVVTGTLHIVPLQPSILTGEPDRGEISDYRSYMNTQAATIVSPSVLERVANDLKDRDLSFFKEDSPTLVRRFKRMMRIGPVTRDAVDVLKAAKSDGVISAAPITGTELLGVTMKSRNYVEARQIVDSLMNNFRNVYGVGSAERTNDTLRKLYDEEKALANTIDQQHRDIVQLARVYGTTALDSRQESEMQRQTTLWTELARVQARKIGLEASLAVAEQAGDSNTPPEQLMATRKEYINADSMVKKLTESIVEMEQNLLIARQNMREDNPELTRREELLASFKQSLKAKEEEVSKEFEEQVAERRQAASRERAAGLRAELEQLTQYEKGLRERLDEQDNTVREVGQADVNLEEKRFQMQVNQDLHDQITRRIKDIEMERQRDPQIQPASPADVVRIDDKRVKYSAMVAFLALACGFAGATLRDKMDKTLQTPEDVTRHVDLPIIGTTTSSRTVRAALFAEHLAGDYQTIRTNLSLLTSGGMPKRLAVSSAGVREGKTTFAINLATSLAKGGKKVLLIDGDLRKPDIAHMLNIVNGSSGLQDVLTGRNPSEAIHVMPVTGLHVLPASQRNSADAYELLTSITAAEQIEKLGRLYDHLIVDTPPALAFPDALVWAKLTDAVVLVGFAGQTMAPDLKETKERFARIRARVLGAVLSNVPVSRLYRSGYGYRPAGAQAKYRTRAAKKALLLTHAQEVGASAGSGGNVSPSKT